MFERAIIEARQMLRKKEKLKELEIEGENKKIREEIKKKLKYRRMRCQKIPIEKEEQWGSWTKEKNEKSRWKKFCRK